MVHKRTAVLDRWLTLILDTYPMDAAHFMRRETNRFSNPVGHTFARAAETLLDALLGTIDADGVIPAIEKINKIRAVQDFSASRAVAFIFLLKTAVREALAAELTDADTAGQLRSLESEIDGMALQAFDSYMRCRETLHDIRCRDIRRQASLSAGQNPKMSTQR